MSQIKINGYYIEMRMIRFTYIAIAVMALSSMSCSKSGSKDTVNKDINDCLEASLPFPTSATLTACTDATVGKSASFRYTVSWGEAVDFFKQAYSTNGWEITSERIDDKPGSMRTAEWSAEKNGTKLAISLSDSRVDDTSGSLQGIVLHFYE